MKTFFIWLGAKRAKRYQIGDKGQLLDQAAWAGLPVPNGGILLDEFYRLALAEGVVVEQNGRIHSPDPAALFDLLYHQVRFPTFDKPVTVRAISSFAPPLSPVQFTNAAQLTDSLCQIWSEVGDAQHDVLVMEMVEEQTRGTAVLNPEDTVDYAQVNGKSHPLSIPRLGPWQLFATADLPPFAQRLQKLLRGVRRSFGAKHLEVEWVDDGRICWLMWISA